MQYKIPVQIENEDKIVLNISFKQLIILVIWWTISFSLFKGLSQNLWVEVALVPSIFIFLFTALIAFLNVSEMTFVPYILNLIRQSINSWDKIWAKWVDSFQAIDIWYIVRESEKQDEKVSITKKIDNLNNLQDKLKDI